MSIVRIGLAETKNFADGYEAIFGKKKTAESNEAKTTVSKSGTAKKKKKTSKKK